MRPEETTPGLPEAGPGVSPSWFRRLLGWFTAPAQPVSLEVRPGLPPGDRGVSVASSSGQPPVSPVETLREGAPAVSPAPAPTPAPPASSVIAAVTPVMPAAPAPVALASASSPDDLLVTGPLRSLADRLALEEVDGLIARSLVQEILRELARDRWDNEIEVYSVAAWVLMRWAQVTGPIKLKPGSLTVVAVLGPTGVGKSTMLAKLASIAAIKERNSVGLISTDTYRIAAADQIRTFARLLSLPLAVVRSREEMAAALKSYASRDVVFVDTAGQSPNDLDRLRELEEILGVEVQIRRLLVLSATTKHSDVQDILQRFEPVGYDGLVITKLDESRSHGVLLNAPQWSGRPLVYLGVGQNIPQDLEVASRERVADLLLNLSGKFHKKK